MSSRLVRLLLMIVLMGLLVALFVVPPYLSTHASAPRLATQSSTVQPNLPFPAWWNGNCDSNNDHGSYPLGASYRGVEVCGPLNTTHPVKFFSTAWTENEWQCTELVFRYLYLAYKVKPYPANGKDVVNNFPMNTYPGLMQQVQNDGKSLLPQAGDILSYDDNWPGNPYGHTSIVTGQVLNKSGQIVGINILQQNSRNATGKLQVKNGIIQSFPYGPGRKYTMSVTGWLHVFSSSPTPTPGTITYYPLPNSLSNPAGITTGPDGNLWFTEETGNEIGRVSLA